MYASRRVEQIREIVRDPGVSSDVTSVETKVSKILMSRVPPADRS